MRSRIEYFTPIILKNFSQGKRTGGFYLGFIKYSNDSGALDAFLSKESSLHDLNAEAARVIGVCTNTEIAIDEDAEVVDVCKAVQEMTEKAKLKGWEEGREESRLESLRNDIKNAMEAFHLSLEDVMKVLKVSKEDQAILMRML